ncbi:hypothetical protein AMATHDRAFT_137855 [Amanita thiersii Skay4041]|uniref:BD-FAE-like domain-containing protein n=1 Tax=Amanita thiersii Skay4041 TaxID=703135 RepID=A0A2A9NZ61_9AGAR|nr:hypothetical protein AMATHDRAFT_137855 [Amanita thiersii Skay4041]
MAYPEPIEIAFKHVDGLDIMMDVYLPEKATEKDPAPVLLWWHGGGLLQGTRKGLGPHMLRAPANHDLCIVSADYRLAPQTRMPSILSDCVDAIKYIRSPAFAAATQNRVNPSKLALSGSSAGGWLSLLNGLGIGYEACGLGAEVPKAGSIAAIAPIYPITDLLDPFWSTKKYPVSYMGRMIERSEVEPFINSVDEKTSGAAVNSRRAIFYHYMVQEGILEPLLLDGTNIPPETFSVAAAIKSRKIAISPPPTYIVHGNADLKVPHRQSTDVVAAYKAIGVEVEYEEPEGLDHGYDLAESVDMAGMYDFIVRALKA